MSTSSIEGIEVSLSEKEQRKLANAERTDKGVKLREGVKELWTEHSARIMEFADEIGVAPDVIFRKVGHFGEETRKTLAANPWNGFKSIMAARFNERK
jgi:hypothetical protein